MPTKISLDTPEFTTWVASVPPEITTDLLWKLRAYRLALYVGDLAWPDATRLLRDRRTISLSGQLYRAVGSVSANLAEAYGRGTGPDRGRLFEYSLGSAREARDWYYKARHMLGNERARHRMELLTQVARLILTSLPYERRAATTDRVRRRSARDTEHP